MTLGPDPSRGPIGDGSHPRESWYEPEPARDWDDEVEDRREAAEAGW